MQGAYSYTAAQLEQVNGNGIRVTGSNLPEHGQQPLTSQGQQVPRVAAPQGQIVQQPGYQQVTGGQGQTTQFLDQNTFISQQQPIVTTQQQHTSVTAAASMNVYGQAAPPQQPQQQFVGNQPPLAMFQQHQQRMLQTLPGQPYGQQQPMPSYPQASLGQASLGQTSLGQPSLGQPNNPQLSPNSAGYCYEWFTDASGQRILVRTPMPQHGHQTAQQHIQPVQQPRQPVQQLRQPVQQSLQPVSAVSHIQTIPQQWHPAVGQHAGVHVNTPQ